MSDMNTPLMSDDEFFQELEARLAPYALLDHPFYQAWNRGELTLAQLREYAKQYYHLEAAFPRMVSAVHSRCPDFDTQQLLLENLNDEQWGSENHRELWLRFAEGLGLTRDEVIYSELLPSTLKTLETLQSLTSREDYREGIAALYAYESQIPQVARTKREGLEKFYGIDDPRAVEFFTVHEHADVVHSQTERDILTQCSTREEQIRALCAVEFSAGVLWGFLSGVYKEYCVGTN